MTILNTIEQFKQFVHYDPETGVFTRVGSNSRTDWIGKRADQKHGKYRRVFIAGHYYYAHQLAYFLCHGKWVDELDHKDRDGQNNRINNLKPCTHQENLCNTGVYKNSKSGIKGVWQNARGYWVAEIRRHGKHAARYFHTQAEAAQARKEMEQQ